MKHLTLPPHALTGGIARFALGVALLASACEAPDVDLTEPAITIAPLESVSHPFTLQGAIAVATCDSVGAPVPRAISSLTMHVHGLASPTCTTPVGLADPTCATRVALQGTGAVLVSTPPSWLYTVPLQRLLFTEPAPPASPQMIGPITYRLFGTSAAGTAPRIYFQTNTRSIQQSLPPIDVTAPSDPSDPAPTLDGSVVTRDLVRQDLVSMRLSFEFEPTRLNAGGTLDLLPGVQGASERISHVRITAIGTTSPAANSITSYFESGSKITDSPGADPAAVSGYLDTPAMALGQKQIVRVELPIAPNAGPYGVTNYTVTAVLTFDDNMQVTLSVPAPSGSDLDPCNVLVLAPRTVAKPRTTLNGSIALRPAAGYATSPYVTHYGPLIRGLGAASGYVRVSSSGGTIFSAVNAVGAPEALAATPASAADPFVFTWTGFPPGDYRVESRNHSSGAVLFPAGHALLSFPGRPAYRYFSGNAPISDVYRAMFAFPTLAATASTAYPDFATSGAFAAQEDAPVALTLEADMAYLGGDLTLSGCITNDALSSGAAELLGASAPLFYGFARGLFLAGDSDYLVAAIAGTWKESRYRMKLDQPSLYNGMMLIEPASPLTYTLATGQTSAGAARTYATSRLTISFDTGGAPVRKARLEVGQDTGASALLVPFYDPAAPTALLGRYYAASDELDAVPVADPAVTIYVPSSGQPVAVRPSAEVQSNGVWAREYRPSLQVLLTSSAAAGCTDTCIQYNLDGSSVSYTDDGQGPVLSGVTPSQSKPTGTTSVWLSGTLTDEVPITHVSIDGVPTPVTSVSDGQDPPTFTATFNVQVSVSEGDNTFSITGKGLCNNVTAPGTVVVITVLPDLCAPPVFDQCMESAPGSVFYIDLRNAADQPCRLPCTIAGPEQALSCEPSAIVCP